jgi:hypothetical protein
MVTRPAETLENTLAYLGLDRDGKTIDSTLEQAAREVPGMAGHRTTGGVGQSVGRWKKDLQSDTIDLCNRAFHDVLDGLDYPA